MTLEEIKIREQEILELIKYCELYLNCEYDFYDNRVGYNLYKFRYGEMLNYRYIDLSEDNMKYLFNSKKF